MIDAAQPGAASPVAAGILAPGSEADVPGPFLDLARRSLAAWPVLAARLAALGEDCGLDLCGLVRPAFDDPDLTRLDEVVRWQRRRGIAVEWLQPAQAADIEPTLAPCLGAAWYPDEGCVDPVVAMAALRRALGRLGGVEVTGRVTGWTPGGALAVSGGEAVLTSTVVVAAGAWSPQVAASLGAPPLPVWPLRGQLLHLDVAGPVPQRVVYGGRLGYVLARRQGPVVVGATAEAAGYDVTPSEAATRSLLAAGARLVPAVARARVVATPVGLRPATPDGEPLVGEVETMPPRTTRLVVATGHHRNGVLLAPATAEAVVTLALEGCHPAEWEPFSPARKLADAPRQGNAPR